MADERDLELLDDYLANRMVGEDRTAFESKIAADPDLRQEYNLQNRLVKGIRDARAAQLKAILNNVPVPSNTGNATGMKIFLGAVATLMIGAAGYWYVSHGDLNRQDAPSKPEAVENIPAPVTPPAVREPESTEDIIEQNPVEQDKNQTSAGTEHSRPSLARKPDPLPGPGSSGRSSGTADLDVETDPDNDRYRFDYRLSEGRLSLFGPFEENGFEVIRYPEGNTTIHFLFYRDTWYRLDPSGAQVKPLVAIADPEVIRKLDGHRVKR